MRGGEGFCNIVVATLDYTGFLVGASTVLMAAES